MQDLHGTRIKARPLIEWLLLNTHPDDDLLIMAPKGADQSELMIWDGNVNAPGARIDVPVFTLDTDFYNRRWPEGEVVEPDAAEIERLQAANGRKS